MRNSHNQSAETNVPPLKIGGDIAHAIQGHGMGQPEPLEITCHQSTEGLAGKELRVRPEGLESASASGIELYHRANF